VRLDTDICFGPFRLDLVGERLWRGAEAVALTPKAFALLRYLAERPGQLLTKQDLLDAIWADALVTDASLHVCIREIREALGDPARAPQYVETVHRRGYRFIGATARDSPPAEPAPGVSSPNPFVGREADLGRLHALLAQALQGRRQVVFVTGEPGIGKTTLVDAFLQRAAADDLCVARGQCFECYGSGEAYLPVFEALGQLGKGPWRERVRATLARHAPTWLAQMPALAPASGAAAPQGLSTTRERMLREMAEALEALAGEAPLVLVLEDLHWGDHATLDLVTSLAQRRGPARLLLVGTYRLVEVIVREHPLRSVKQELQTHQLCHELALDLLSESAVAEYLATRFAGCTFAAELARRLHTHSDGNPLFLVNVVDYLVAQGKLLAREDGAWELSRGLAGIEVGVPENIRLMIERQADQLGADERRLLEAGSVAGAEFPAAAVGAALGQDAELVEGWCEQLARRQQFLRRGALQELADGTVTPRYRFVHALYQNVLYQRLPPAQRHRLHRRVGAWVEAAFGPGADEVAAEAAMHFEQGRDYDRAVHYLQQAADRAVRLLAHREAIGHARKGLDLLHKFADTPARAGQELRLQMTLGVQLQISQGFAAPEVEGAYARARELCGRLPETPQLVPVLWGLWMFYGVRPAYRSALEVADQLLRLGEGTQDAMALLHGHLARGITCLYVGDLAAARSHLQRVTVLYVPEEHQAHLSGLDPRVACLAQLSNALWLLGYPDQAREACREAIRWAEQLSHPHSQAVAQFFAAIVHQRRREPEVVCERAGTLLRLAAEQGFLFWSAGGAILHGWALVEMGSPAEGIAELRQGLAAWQASGAGVNQPYYLALLAEALDHMGQAEEGLAALGEALELARATGEHYYEAELHRLQGELLLRHATAGGRRTKGSPPQAPSARREAEACFREAITLARQQRAKALELRAARSWTCLAHRQDDADLARQHLEETYGWFTEGSDTADLREAKALLETLS
jgi:predicted ATPase/DNA-binding winged helix-turn-helix (wHTH) protein